jgi:hypothetical protein
MAAVPTNVKEAHLALDRDRSLRRQSLDDQIRLKNENIEKEILTNRNSLGGHDQDVADQNDEDEGRESLVKRISKKHLKNLNETIDRDHKSLIQRNMSSNSRLLNQSFQQDLELIKSFSYQDKIDFMSSRYDLLGDHVVENETAEQFLLAMGITKDSCSDEEWKEWVIALSKSAAYDRSTRRRSTSTAPLFAPSSNQPLSHANGQHRGEQSHGEVIVPIKRESVADIRRRFSSRSKLDTETDYQRMIRRNFSLSQPSSSRDCETVRGMNSTEKIEFLSTWYEILREKREEEGEGFIPSSHETAEEFLLSFGVCKETCQEEEQWREWVIALSKSAASDRSSKRRKSSSTKKLESSEEAAGEEGGADEERMSDFLNPKFEIPLPEITFLSEEDLTIPPPQSQSQSQAESQEGSTLEKVISSPSPQVIASVSASASVPASVSEEGETDKVTSTATQTQSEIFSSSSQSLPNSSPRTYSSTSHVDDFHSQVISSSSSLSSTVEYKKSLSAASVVFAQAPDEDRESMWSNVELSFSEVARTSAQNPYTKPDPPAPAVSSPLHSNGHHISIDDPKQTQRSPKKSSCCVIL